MNNKTHAVLDYGLVLVFALLPKVFKLDPVPAFLGYALACVHFIMTVCTDFEFGLMGQVPVFLHKLIEKLLGPTVMVLPLAAGFYDDLKARYVFMGAGVIVIIISIFSEYAPDYVKQY
jgi:hypothetical protein